MIRCFVDTISVLWGPSSSPLFLAALPELQPAGRGPYDAVPLTQYGTYKSESNSHPNSR